MSDLYIINQEDQNMSRNNMFADSAQCYNDNYNQ